MDASRLLQYKRYMFNMALVYDPSESTTTECISFKASDYQHKWIKAIVENDGNLVRQLLADISYDKLCFPLSTVLAEELDICAYLKPQCPGTVKVYIPDDAWCLAALYSARDVLQILREFSFPATGINLHGNTFLHCIIAQASFSDEEQEEQALSNVQFIKDIVLPEEYNKLLLTDNKDGLRPLELASHLGTFSVYQFLLETEGVYKNKIRDFEVFSIQYFDITDYVTGKRYFKSPMFTMMHVDRSKIMHKHLQIAFQTDPMKSWLNAIKYSNIPYVDVLAFFRLTYIACFLVSLLLAKTMAHQNKAAPNQQMPAMNVSTNQSDNVTSHDTDNTLLLVVLIYNTIYSISVLSFDTIYFLFCLSLYHDLKWSKYTTTGTKNPAVYKMVYFIADGFTVIGILILSVDILYLQLNGQTNQPFSSNSVEAMACIATFACVWDILYYLQVIPGLSLYVIAVQRMLIDFFAFGVVFMLFFFAYVFGFYILDVDANSFLDSAYGTFQLMLNISNPAKTNGTIQILHVTFIFMIVYLLLNILIAIFASSFEYVYKERHMILAIQSLSVYLLVDPVVSRIMRPLHRHLQRKYFVVEDGRVYVTKIVQKPVHTWWECATPSDNLTQDVYYKSSMNGCHWLVHPFFAERAMWQFYNHPNVNS